MKRCVIIGTAVALSADVTSVAVAGYRSTVPSDVFVPLLVLQLPVEPPPGAIVLAFTFSLFLWIIFGVYPAKTTATLHPIKALRYE